MRYSALGLAALAAMALLQGNRTSVARADSPSPADGVWEVAWTASASSSYRYGWSDSYTSGTYSSSYVYLMTSGRSYSWSGRARVSVSSGTQAVTFDLLAGAGRDESGYTYSSSYTGGTTTSYSFSSTAASTLRPGAASTPGWMTQPPLVIVPFLAADGTRHVRNPFTDDPAHPTQTLPWDTHTDSVTNGVAASTDSTAQRSPFPDFAGPSDLSFDPVTGTYHAHVSTRTPRDAGYVYSYPGGRYEYIDSSLAETEWDVTVKPPANNLRINGIKVAQVVFDPDINGDGKIDLVAGRKAVVQIDAEATGGDASMLSTDVVIRATFRGEVVANTTVKWSSLVGGDYVLLYFVPDPAGAGDLTVTIDPDDTIAEGAEDDNSDFRLLDVKDTQPLFVEYRAINSPGLYATTTATDVSDMASRSGEFMLATFPIPYFQGSTGVEQPGSTLATEEGIVSDAELLQISAGLDNGISVSDKVLGVVGLDYFQKHGFGPTVTGYTPHCYAGSNAAVVMRGNYETAAHEIGHTEGLRCSPFAEEYAITEAYGRAGFPAGGFWVEHGTYVGMPEQDGVTCFMGRNPEYDLDHRWIDADDYAQLFRVFRTDPHDPEILLLSGILHDDGRFEQGPWYFLPAGAMTDSEPGAFAVRVSDPAGNVLTTTTLDVQFTAHVEPLGELPTHSVPVVVAVPFPDSAASLEVSQGGQVVSASTPSFKVLHDAIAAIPDAGFAGGVTTRRKALQNKIDAIEKMVAGRATKGALKALVQDLRKQVDAWILDDYPLTSPLQLAKARVLRTIDAMVSRVANLGS